MHRRLDSSLALAGLTLAVLATVGFSADAFAAVKNTGVMAMSPARRSVVARPPVRLSATTISNTTPSTIKVKVFTALVSQKLDGTFVFSEDARSLNIGRLVLNAEPTSFTLAPKQSQPVHLRWQVMPRGKVAV